MSRKTSICVANVQTNIPITLVSPITSDAVQTVTFRSSNKNVVTVDNTPIVFDKNNLSKMLSVVGNTSGSYNIEYTIRAGFTNAVLTNLINVEFVKSTTPNGFISSSQSCGNYLYIYENNEYFNGSVVGVYTTDSNAHALSFRSDNSSHGFNIISVDPSGNEVAYTASTQTTTITSSAPYRYIRIRVLTATFNPSWSELRIYQPGSATNIAQGKTVFADQDYGAPYNPPAAVDGNLGTRWSATDSAAQNFTVDLGASYSIGQVDIVRSQYDGMTSYKIQGSNNNSTYDDLYTSGTFSGYPPSIPNNTVESASLSSNSSYYGVNINITAGNPGIWKFIPAAPFVTAITGSMFYIPSATLTFIADSTTLNSVPVYYQGIGFLKPNDCVIP